MVTPVVLVHGFTQTARCWAPLDDLLRARASVVALDLPGHGAGPDVPADLWEAAELVADEALVRVGGPATWVGYSMGGRLALHVALARPEAVASMVLVGATPGIEDLDDRSARREADEALADRLELIGVDAFLEEWLARPMFAGIPPERRCLEERRRNRVEGLAAALRRLGTGSQEPLWDRLGELSMPVVAMAGERDEKFTAIARRMATSGTVDAVVVPDVGHAVHLERPDATLALLPRSVTPDGSPSNRAE